MKKKKLSKIGFIILSAIILTLGIIVLIRKNSSSQQESEVNKIMETAGYSLKVDYPIIENKKINKKIEKYIQEKEQEFLSIAEKPHENFIYDFKVNYSLSKIKNINEIHIVLYSFTGGAHYLREDKVFRYDETTGQKVDLTQFLEDDKFTAFKNLVRKEIKKVFQNKNKEVDETWIEEGTNTLDNYEIYEFNENSMVITFPPYQISSWSDGEITVEIPKEKLRGIIKEEFLNLPSKETPVFTETPAQRDLTAFEEKKLLAFTFDDGPSSKSTSKLLDNLDKYNARVTFFVLGSRVSTFKDNLKRAYKMGNTIGSHTYNHLNLYKETPEAQLEEIESANDAIESIIGTKPIYLRPPYGNIKNEVKEKSGMYTILWNIDTEDWKKKNAEKIANHIIKHAHDGAIILLHDIYSYSVDGALLAMEALKDEYAFVSLDEMITLKKKTLEPLKSYYGF